MLDCDPLDCEDPSLDSGGVSAPELEVHVLDLGRVAMTGFTNTGSVRTSK